MMYLLSLFIGRLADLYSPCMVRKKYEFDKGVHYVGDVSSQTLTKTLCDQITDGQLEWVTLDNAYTAIAVGYGEEEENGRHNLTVFTVNIARRLSTRAIL
jgi:hypothetical protein